MHFRARVVNCEEYPMTRFILLFAGRTGSSYVMECLDSHPNIVARPEWLGQRADHEQNELIIDFFSNHHSREGYAVGFKTKLRDIKDRETFTSLLHKYGIHILQMQRLNVVKLAISRINSHRVFQRSGKWNLQEGESPLSAFHLAPDELRENIVYMEEQRQELEAFVEALELPTLRIEYEDLLTDEAEMFRRIFAFLGVRDLPVESSFVKATSDDLGLVITNYEELRSQYADTAYAEMF